MVLGSRGTVEGVGSGWGEEREEHYLLILFTTFYLMFLSQGIYAVFNVIVYV